MSHGLKVCILASLGCAGFAQIALAEAFTTRIEPRPFYGAVVTLEEGVRVIRPLPPERQVIINPNNATPLSLGFNETRVYESRHIYDHRAAAPNTVVNRRIGGGIARRYWGYNRGYSRFPGGGVAGIH